VTPEKIYTSCNLMHQDYERSGGVSGLISIDVYLLQVRVTATAEFSNAGGAPNTPITNAAAPSGQSPVNLGQVQPQPATPQQQAYISNILGQGGS
jgi:hypothetical protein